MKPLDEVPPEEMVPLESGEEPKERLKEPLQLEMSPHLS
jgi:hypothetical protein